MPDTSHVLVTGATGAIGRELADTLIACGSRVTTIGRAAPPFDPSARTPRFIHGDITDSRALRTALMGVDTVYHLAAKLHVNRPGPELRAEYERVNVQGTRAVLDAAASAGVRRVVLFSTINVYGASRRDEILDERSPLAPDSWYAESKVRAEQLALSSGIAVVLRLAAVYGPSMKGNYCRLLDAVRRRRFAHVGGGTNRRTLAYSSDVCGAAWLAAIHPAAAGQIYNVTDGSIHTVREIIASMAEALGQQTPRLRVPASMAFAAAGVVESGLRLLRKPATVGPATIRKLIEDIAVSGDKLQNELGFCPRVDLFSGWRQIVAGKTAREPIRRRAA